MNMADRLSSSSEPSSSRSDNTVELNDAAITTIVRRVYDSIQTFNGERHSPGTRTTNASVAEEMAQRFSLPRAGQGQGQRSLGNRFNNSRSRFNPQVNYGHGSIAKGKGKGKSGKVKETVLHKKELILLPYPTYAQVPRFEHKRKLQELGLIVDGFPLDKSWDEHQLRLKIGGAFVQKLEDEQGEFVQFEFVKSIGQNICPLNLYGNKEPSGENIYHMCKQGPVYVRASKTLKVWALGELDGMSENCNETEDEVTAISMGSSIDSHATGIKRRRQSTLSFTSQDSKLVPGNTDIHQYPSCSTVGNNSTSAPGVRNESSVSSSTTAGPSGFLNATYTEYISIASGDNEFDDDEDDDPELAQAIAASLHEASVTADTRSTQDLVTCLQQENLSADIEENVKITIQRKNVLSSTIRAINRSSFSFFRRVLINFSGEDAVDGGGPKREFFRLLMKSVKEIGIFEGRWFSHDISLLKDGKYALVGKLIGWSILQGGPGPRCMSDEGYNMLCEKPYSRAAAIEDVSEEQLKEVLRNINSCATEDDFSALVLRHGEEISNHGLSRIFLLKFNDKEDVISGLLRQYFVFRVHAEIEQFFDGLNHVAGIGAIVKKNPPVFASFFSANIDPFTLAQFKMLCNIFWSPEGSNTRMGEDSTIYCWEAYLQDTEENPGDITIEDVLAFITGADHIPPLGLPKSIDIHFYDYDMDSNCKRRPWTSTCALSLHLPRGMNNPDEFSQLLNECILSSPGLDKL